MPNYWQKYENTKKGGEICHHINAKWEFTTLYLGLMNQGGGIMKETCTSIGLVGTASSMVPLGTFGKVSERKNKCIFALQDAAVMSKIKKVTSLSTLLVIQPRKLENKPQFSCVCSSFVP